MRISVFGLGYVGAVTIGCTARDGHQVIGVDIDETKLRLISEGKSPVIEEGMPELIAGAAESGRVTVTQEASEALQKSDLSFLCVGTPSQPNGSIELDAMTRLCSELGEALKQKDGYHTFVVRSTVLPGTTDHVLRPLIEKHSGKKAGKHFDLCFQPEFMREGSSIQDFDNPPFTVVGTDSDRCESVLRAVFGHLPTEFHRTTTRTAEMLKYSCNIFHAVKITFANEIGRIAQVLGVNPHQTLELLCKDRQLNISPAYLNAGFAFGGSCLPKDLRGLLYAAKHQDVSTPMLNGVLPSNRDHVDHAVEMVLESGIRKVGMLGLSFKSGTDDLRESPLVTMAERFIGKGLDLKIYDPAVSLARLIGANRKYIEESIPHIGSLMCGDFDVLLEHSELIVVGLRNADLLAQLREKTRPEQTILDLVNIPDREVIQGHYFGVCW